MVVPDRVELVGEVRTAGLGGVELRARKGRGSDATTQSMGSEFECEGATHVRLDEHGEASADNAITLLALRACAQPSANSQP